MPAVISNKFASRNKDKVKGGRVEDVTKDVLVYVDVEEFNFF